MAVDYGRGLRHFGEHDSSLFNIVNLVLDSLNHGHHVLAAAHVVASHAESLCPMVEHGIAWLPGIQRAQTRSISPEAGYLATPAEPGLGPDIDWNRFERA